MNVPGFRHVEVTARAKGMGKLDVRTRTGYYPVAHPRQTAQVAEP
jgi:Ca-activated chloride channel homolog